MSTSYKSRCNVIRLINISIMIYFFGCSSLFAQVFDTSIDDAGDIAFIAYHDNIDGFAFVFLDDCPNGTTIRFIDEGWNGTAFNSVTSEGEDLWTNNTGATLAQGTVVKIESANNSPVASVGTVTEIESGFSLSLVSDQIYAVTGTRAAPGTFLAFVGNGTTDGGNAISFTGTGLVAGQTALIIPTNGTSEEGYYTGATSCNGTLVQCSAMINTIGNWSIGEYTYPTVVPDSFSGGALPVELSSFSITMN